MRHQQISGEGGDSQIKGETPHFDFLILIFSLCDPSVLSPLQPKAVLIFEFIKTRRVLSNREIPFQALKLNLKTTNKENYKSRK